MTVAFEKWLEISRSRSILKPPLKWSEITPECDQLSKAGEDSGRPEEQSGLRENIQG